MQRGEISIDPVFFPLLQSDVCLTVKMVVLVFDGTVACVLKVIQDIIVNLEW